MKRNCKELVEKMTLEEKAGLCSGKDFWHLKSVERLGVPSVMVSDGPHGLRKQDESGDHLGINESIKAVCFPPACLSACSFDRDLMTEFGETVGKEAQATDLSVILGPAVNIKRSPLCGRNFEYYSEDPLLAGEIAAAFIQGVQSEHVGTSVKHFAANNQEFNRMSSSSDVDERTLREIYFPAFETAVKKAHPYTIMCSYNQINGTFASENEWLLTDVLRKEWGFDGYVVSDWGAVNERVPGLRAGLDLEMPSSGGESDQEIIDAVRNGKLDEAVVDQAAERILDVIFRYLDNRREVPLTLEEDHAVASRIAKESMVLLKNEAGVLPLQKEESVAFIGEFAKTPRYQGGGSSHINSFKVVSALDALSLVPHGTVQYAKGFSAEKDEYDEMLAEEAVKLAASSDKAVIFAGLPDAFESEGYDRNHMELPACQNRLIEEILKVQPNTVVVLHNGSPVEMPWLSKTKGILEAYLGGQAVGEAVVSILYGKTNPSGKLAETFPCKLSDNPSYMFFGNGDNVEYREGVYVGYRYYDTKKMPVAFPFGHGLSYTTFAYSNMQLSRDHMTDQDTVTVSVDVTNTGSVPGKEIVELYVSDMTKAAGRPVHELKNFEKTELMPGETKTVQMQLNKRSFAWYNTKINDWYMASGQYRIEIGASSADIRLCSVLTIDSSVKLPIHVTSNTTLGELFADERTKTFAGTLAGRMGSAFKPEKEEGSESAVSSAAISDEMNKAMLQSMPLRNLASFGLMSKKELKEQIDALNETMKEV